MVVWRALTEEVLVVVEVMMATLVEAVVNRGAETGTGRIYVNASVNIFAVSLAMRSLIQKTKDLPTTNIFAICSRLYTLYCILYI